VLEARVREHVQSLSQASGWVVHVSSTRRRSQQGLHAAALRGLRARAPATLEAIGALVGRESQPRLAPRRASRPGTEVAAIRALRRRDGDCGRRGWRELAWTQHCAVTAISFPLLAYYGYFAGAAVPAMASEVSR
jgi:hypothetical protein